MSIYRTYLSGFWQVISHKEFMNRIHKSMYYGRAKLSIPLSDYITEAFSEAHNSYSLNRLDHAVVGRLRTTPCSLILALIYFERLKDSDPAYCKQITPTDLFLISMVSSDNPNQLQPQLISSRFQMVATKFYSGHDDDSPSVNWSELAKTTPENLLQMELNFLSSLNWNVYVSNEEFFEKVASVERNLASQQGLHRGWLTYMELSILMPSIQITKSFMEITFVLGLSYAAFFATIVASFFLVSTIPGSCLRPPCDDSAAVTSSQTAPELNTETSNLTVDTNASLSENALEIDDLTFIENVLNDTDNKSNQSDSRAARPSIGREMFKWPVIFNQINSPSIDFCNDPAGNKRFNLRPKRNTTLDHSLLNKLFHFKSEPLLSMKTEYKFQLI